MKMTIEGKVSLFLIVNYEPDLVGSQLNHSQPEEDPVACYTGVIVVLNV